MPSQIVSAIALDARKMRRKPARQARTSLPKVRANLSAAKRRARALHVACLERVGAGAQQHPVNDISGMPSVSLTVAPPCRPAAAARREVLESCASASTTESGPVGPLRGA